MSMEEKVVAFAHVTWANAGIPQATRAYNCTVAAGAVPEEINVTIGEGGADRTLCQIVAVANRAGLASPSTIHTSDTVKRIQFRDAAGALVAPLTAYIEIKRLPPLPPPGV